MEQLERISHMETILNEAETALRDLSQALESYQALKGQIAELEDYYESPQWMLDFSADEAGALPRDLKRGVLSEDGIYNLLELQKEVLAELRKTGEEASYD